MATITSLMGQNPYGGLNKASANWYKLPDQMNMQSQALQSLYDRNNSKLISVMEKRSSIYDKNLETIAKYNANSKVFFSGFSNNLGALQKSSAALRDYSPSSVLNPVGYTSSNSNVVSINSGSVYSTGNMTVKVDRLATGQITQSASLDSNSTGGFNGYSNLKITTGEGKAASLSFNFSPTTSNKQAIQEIAKSVNNSKLGISASVVEKDGKSTLKITSGNTGGRATIDLQMSDNLQEQLNPQITQTAQNAAFFVNGVEKTSQTNSLSLSTNGTNNMNVTLKGIGEATLGKSTMDASKVVETVKTFAKDINNAVDFLNKNLDKSTAVKALSNSLSSFRYRSASLGEIGINVGNGKVTVDETKLTKALTDSPDKVKSLLGGISGFATQVNTTATNAMRNQTQFMPPPQLINSIDNTGNLTMSYPFNQGIFTNNLPYAGTIFDLLA